MGSTYPDPATGLWHRLRRAVPRAALLGLVLAGPVAHAAEPAPAGTARTETALFAGGCFWCVESDFDKVPGVLETISGFAGGALDHPSYRQVSAGGTGHREVVKVVFDPARVSYRTLVDYFWRTVDPTDAGGQFCDRGDSYTTAIFTQSAQQQAEARASLEALTASHRLPAPVVTEIRAETRFWPAEDYHQDYYEKNPLRYKYYRYSCGRDARLADLWGGDAHRLPGS
ncbi:peptide-methionine (S)-S-oxide reductase MsrA [Oleisolibacter albus]|uniref:peptide-methionine (S)-S-oxide reductase MsrA n=1 Tax=Oleisolibacter albus TaxID=2171757 RepID=UPI000DF1E8C1|nr:peptide-methionine (S)-S-oxide reductase MsrA [Oleisolibacter albus]